MEGIVIILHMWCVFVIGEIINNIYCLAFKYNMKYLSLSSQLWVTPYLFPQELHLFMQKSKQIQLVNWENRSFSAIFCFSYKQETCIQQCPKEDLEKLGPFCDKTICLLGSKLQAQSFSFSQKLSCGEQLHGFLMVLLYTYEMGDESAAGLL